MSLLDWMLPSLRDGGAAIHACSMDAGSRMTLPKYARWLTSKWTRRIAFAATLLFVFLWPHTDLTVVLVLLTSIPGLIGLTLWGLSFWHKARVQIGRLQLRYKRVRYVAGVIAVICLLVPFAQYLGLRVENHMHSVWASRWAQYYRASRAQYRFVVAFTHFDGDEKDRVAGALMESLEKIDSRLAVSPDIVNHTIVISGNNPGIGHLEALGIAGDASADMVIWGKADMTSDRVTGPIYLTNHGEETSFSGAYLPGDFKLPDIPSDQLSEVLQMIVATNSATVMHQMSFPFGDALESPIKRVRILADDPRKTSNWSADTQARVYFALGRAMGASGYELNSHDSIEEAANYFKKALGKWDRDHSPLEWAMTQKSLGATLESLTATNDPKALQGAMDAYRASIAAYQSQSDKLDAFGVQYRLGEVLNAMALRSGSADLIQQAIAANQAAAAGLDERSHPYEWAAAQMSLAASYRILSDQESKPDNHSRAIAAYQAALRVYRQDTTPQMWIEAQEGVAMCLLGRGELTSNRKDLERAVSISREVVAVCPRDRNPIVWASAQARLAHSLRGLGELDSNVLLLGQAGGAYQAALSEFTRANNPSDWADAEDGLAETYLALGKKTPSLFYLRQAADAYAALLQVYTREENPRMWAWTKYNQGNALYDVASWENSIPRLKESIESYRAALTVLSKKENPEQWKQTEENLNTALSQMHDLGG